jgi:hypothetical protein
MGRRHRARSYKEKLICVCALPHRPAHAILRFVLFCLAPQAPCGARSALASENLAMLMRVEFQSA